MPKNVLVGQSGGPTAAINASLAGVIAGALENTKTGGTYGTRNGIKGVLNDRIVDLTHLFKTKSDIEMLKGTPAMALGSCRCKLPDFPSDVYGRILEVLKKYDIGYFFYIGGNDSMDTVAKLSDYFKTAGEDIKIVGIPKTIDNDLCVTDHTPGFGSAAKFIATSVSEIACDSVVYDCDSVTVIEIMGRNSGWLTAASALARLNGNSAPQMIYLPERAFSPQKFLTDLKTVMDKNHHVVVAVSEGLKLSDGRYAGSSEQSGIKDAFGHEYLSGTGKYLEHLVIQRFRCKVRSVNLNVLQRCASHLSSGTDINEAYEIGRAAVEIAVNGNSGVTAVIKRDLNDPYKASYDFCDVKKVANLVKFVPDDFISENGYDVTGKMIEYLKPLIMGEGKRYVKNGLPVSFRLDSQTCRAGKTAVMP